MVAIIDELLKQNSDTSRIKLDTKQIDMLRDVALSLENLNIAYAHDLMQIAYSARPDGDYIKNKLAEYHTKLS